MGGDLEGLPPNLRWEDGPCIRSEIEVIRQEKGHKRQISDSRDRQQTDKIQSMTKKRSS